MTWKNFIFKDHISHHRRATATLPYREPLLSARIAMSRSRPLSPIFLFACSQMCEIALSHCSGLAPWIGRTGFISNTCTTSQQESQGWALYAVPVANHTNCLKHSYCMSSKPKSCWCDLSGPVPFLMFGTSEPVHCKTGVQCQLSHIARNWCKPSALQLHHWPFSANMQMHTTPLCGHAIDRSN